MERRDFLRSAGLGLAATGLGLATTWPGVLSRAFGDEGAPPANGPRERTVELGEAIARARRYGKPLMLLVVPANKEGLWQRGRSLGELINHGGAEVRDDLLLCELACATLAEAKGALRLDVTKDDPAMVLVELDGEGGEFLPSTAIDLPAAAGAGRGDVEDEAPIRARIALAAAAVHAAVRPTPAALAQRAERNRAALPEPIRTALADGLAGRSPISADLARRGAAELLVAATDGSADAKPRARAALDAGAEAAIVRARPPGAQWANSAGCGTDIEGEKPEMVDCGMGRVPELSRRFLHFYAKE